MTIKLVVFDADKTLWNHRDISSLILPLKLVSRDIVADANGETFQLFEGVRELLESLENKKVIITMASWNKPEPVEEALRLLRIDRFFQIVKAEFHPNKYVMIESIISELAKRGIELKSNEILYVDDRTLHLEQIRSKIGPIHFIQMWIDAKTPNEIMEYVEKMENDNHYGHTQSS
jgi:magnesium-dependent phosphatase-1